MNLLGVSSTTIKRWADAGRIPCYRTVGGHRRFDAVAVRDLLGPGQSGITEFGDGLTQKWLDILEARDVSYIIVEMRRLLQVFDDWFDAADFIAHVARKVSQRWVDGECSLFTERVTSFKLAHAISAVSSSQPVRDDAERCAVASLANAHRGFDALLTQLCMRSRGLDAVILDTDILATQLSNGIEHARIRLLAILASSWRADEDSVGLEAARFASICQRVGSELALGGAGAWPDDIDHLHRFRSYAELRDVLRRTGL